MYPIYKDNLIYYFRSIYNILIVWKYTVTNNNMYESFILDLNKTYCLKWAQIGLRKSMNFLDLTLTINDKTGKVDTKTYQNPMNIYQYTPYNSVHSPKNSKYMVYILIQTYWNQNTYKKGFTTPI